MQQNLLVSRSNKIRNKLLSKFDMNTSLCGMIGWKIESSALLFYSDNRNSQFSIMMV